MLKSMQARGQYRWLIILLLALAVAIPAVGVAGAEPLGERERQREIFRQGWAAAGRGDQTGLLLAIGALPDYPLVPYLEYELLRQRLDKVPAAVLANFLARYPDWSFAATLELAWLRSLGQRGEDEALLRYGPDSADPEVRCYLALTRIARQEYDGLEDEIEFLWLTGRSAKKIGV
ncbi:hypothetical protein [Desulfurivibrio dismutans]|uniref:hypothetical protein n=1 Tax=Desulfurivibrio dismutans TaxID=1398908 RepID=UPI0023DB8E39|nr:hypothetical protein [Desulfurivibrio alkaliphilus]MDF1615689.1 hypothetical protein [Desulfurivibrio alkaliphilus]